MKSRSVLVICVFVLGPMFSATRRSVVCANPQFAGHWEGKMNGLPGIDLQIDEAEGKITGRIIFYYQERSDPNGPWRTKAEYPATLLAPRVEGQVLTFEVEHHKCHTCKELGPNAKFRMELAGSDEARLWNLEYEREGKEVPPMKLARTRPGDKR
jgi:hypothetical protein